MGAASSVNSFTNEQKAIISKGIQEIYSDSVVQNEDNEDIQRRIIAKYEELVTQTTKSSTAGSTSLKSPPAKAGGLRATPSPLRAQSMRGKGVTRRRSFDVNATTASFEAKKRGMAGSSSTPVLAPGPASNSDGLEAVIVNNVTEYELDNSPQLQVDCWDSVAQQPFCDLCNMAFKSFSVLDRHVKYSELHTTMMKRASGTETIEQIPLEQKEGVHYKLIYWCVKSSLLLLIFTIVYLI